jgi:hypothetical protein
MGPAKLRCKATFKNGVWRETASYAASGRRPMTVIDIFAASHRRDLPAADNAGRPALIAIACGLLPPIRTATVRAGPVGRGSHGGKYSRSFRAQCHR